MTAAQYDLKTLEALVKEALLNGQVRVQSRTNKRRSYGVTIDQRTRRAVHCTCIGHAYRGRCSHVDGINYLLARHGGKVRMPKAA